MKPTPGPWKYLKAFSAVVVIKDHMVRVIADFGKIEHHEANARLIAAAPDLLGISKELIKWESDPDKYGGDLADLARLAIKIVSKAEVSDD